MTRFTSMAQTAALSVMLSAVAGTAFAEWRQETDAAAYQAECFRPWTADTATWVHEASEGPYRIAVVNSFTGNTWRIQMLKTLLAFAETPEMKGKIEELKVISTGTDVSAQIAAMEDFINQGYDAVIANAMSTDGFNRVIRAGDRSETLVMTFDNILDTDKVMQLSSDNHEFGRLQGEFLVDKVGTTGKILEVRGLPGISVDLDRHQGLRDVLDQHKGIEIVEVVGNWDDGTAQKVVADAIATHGEFAGFAVQAGSTGALRAILDAGHPLVPIAAEAENGFRKMAADLEDDGLEVISVGYSPALGAIAVKAAVSALEGNPLPQLMSVPLPVAMTSTLEDGQNYWSNLDDNFFTPNEFPPCNVNFTAEEIMAQDAE
ncbi:sugar ABC transporter substrate-binding protein [Shimia thalassica]|uniref:sugar ABC transporter substrate-binding protein n=1 Tax=Shimia thalassica TaxID=1715693 RepID=UPI0026E290EC|nr:sugar ABC transporter substrate-binding protein [Shimia thalassica]MDO6486006.1 sugar ABC transporter substrate-binding protein [Shimia thalassica]MDO6523826.1 sugar ABC transporter substrate-binding protein [Shimia thalassica]MDP2582248.1 sugar ABC transporter substrate-binding protein [Shimia thalassica]